jgi:hypothetical protein
MTAAEAQAAIRQLDADRPNFVVLLFGDELARSAGRLAATHGIRAAMPRTWRHSQL